ncbi:MAG: FmdB family zinc ribbon protein [Thermoleophilia bacterium]
MPIYEYRCLKCGHQFEKMQKISDSAVSHCEKCGKRVTRVFHPVAIHFKGSGFYSTDYGKKKTSRAKESEKPVKREEKPRKKAASKSDS